MSRDRHLSLEPTSHANGVDVVEFTDVAVGCSEGPLSLSMQTLSSNLLSLLSFLLSCTQTLIKTKQTPFSTFHLDMMADYARIRWKIHCTDHQSKTGAHRQSCQTSP